MFATNHPKGSFIGGNCPGRNYPGSITFGEVIGRLIVRGQLSAGAIVQETTIRGQFSSGQLSGQHTNAR